MTSADHACSTHFVPTLICFFHASGHSIAHCVSWLRDCVRVRLESDVYICVTERPGNGRDAPSRIYVLRSSEIDGTDEADEIIESLHELSVDRVELHNLAAKQPERVKRMAAQWDAWAQRSYVDTWQDAYDPYLNGKPRENWGMSGTPNCPAAMKQRSSANIR